MTDTSGSAAGGDEKTPNSDALVQPGDFGFGRAGADPKEVAFFHRGDDVDKGEGAHHHTLGEKRGQAASGLMFGRLRIAYAAFVAGFNAAVNALITASVPAMIAARPDARNLLRNARGRINQHAAVSATSLALNAYFLDGWKATTAASAVTWTGSDAAGRVITVPASKSIGQDVEQADVFADNYLLINYGTAQGRVYNVGAGAPVYANATVLAPLVVALDGLADVRVEFGPGTVINPILIRAATWKGYLPDISIAQDLAWCQRFFVRFTVATSVTLSVGAKFSTTGHSVVVPFPTSMRAVPTVAQSNMGMADTVSSQALTAISSASPQLSLAVLTLTTAAFGGTNVPGILQGRAAVSYVEFSSEL